MSVAYNVTCATLPISDQDQNASRHVVPSKIPFSSRVPSASYSSHEVRCDSDVSESFMFNVTHWLVPSIWPRRYKRNSWNVPAGYLPPAVTSITNADKIGRASCRERV